VRGKLLRASARPSQRAVAIAAVALAALGVAIGVAVAAAGAVVAVAGAASTVAALACLLSARSLAHRALRTATRDTRHDDAIAHLRRALAAIDPHVRSAGRGGDDLTADGGVERNPGPPKATPAATNAATTNTATAGAAASSAAATNALAAAANSGAYKHAEFVLRAALPGQFVLATFETRAAPPQTPPTDAAQSPAPKRPRTPKPARVELYKMKLRLIEPTDPLLIDVGGAAPLRIATWQCEVLDDAGIGIGVATTFPQAPTDVSRLIGVELTNTSTTADAAREQSAVVFTTKDGYDFDTKSLDSIVVAMCVNTPLLRLIPPHLNRPFVHLAKAHLAKYVSATATPEEREAAGIEFVLLIQTRGRQLLGATSRQQEAFIKAQLVSNKTATQIDLKERRAESKARHGAKTDAFTMEQFDLNKIKQANDLVREGHISRANAALARTPQPTQDPLITEANLRRLHPKEEAEHAARFGVGPTPKVFTRTFDPTDVAAMIKSSCSGASPGPSGWREEMLLVLCADEEALIFLARFLTDIANDDVAPLLRRVLVLSTLMGIPKKDDGTRPIALGEVLVKLAEKLSLATCQTELQLLFANA
jgi:hypothetical protein